MYTAAQIIEAIESLRNDPGRDVNVNQIRLVLNGGNRDRIRRILEEYERAQAHGSKQTEADAVSKHRPLLAGDVRDAAGKTLAEHMNSMVTLLDQAAAAERAKADKELAEVKSSFEARLRDRDADVARAQQERDELCEWLSTNESDLDAAYGAAAKLAEERDAMARERDRLAAEAARLADENARLSAAVSAQTHTLTADAKRPRKRTWKTSSSCASKPGADPDDVRRAETDVAAQPAKSDVVQSVMFTGIEDQVVNLVPSKASMTRAPHDPAHDGHHSPHRADRVGTG